MSALTGNAFGEILVRAGVLTQYELNRTRRIIIDAQSGEVVVMYIERVGDHNLLSIEPGLEGAEIVRDVMYDEDDVDEGEQPKQ